MNKAGKKAVGKVLYGRQRLASIPKRSWHAGDGLMIWHIWNREYGTDASRCEAEQVGELPPVVLKRWGFSSVQRLPSVFKTKIITEQLYFSYTFIQLYIVINSYELIQV